MALLSDPKARPIYVAAERFVDQALRSDGSLFTPGRRVWTLTSIQDLRRRFVEAPDLSSDSFVEKFERQLAGAPAETLQLAAELIYVHFLIALDIGGAAKRRLTSRVLGWLPLPVTIPEELDEALDRGLAASGVAFKTYRPYQLWFLVDFALGWKNLPPERRDELLADPWAFKTFLETVPLKSAYAQFNALLHLVHPQTFEPIVSREHKEAIAAAFAQVGETSADVDRRLIAARRALTAQYGEPFWFYQPGVVEQWRSTGPSDRQIAEPEVGYVAGNPIRDRLASFLNDWPDAREQPLKSHPIQQTLLALRDELAEGAGVDRVAFRVDSSVGSGNWAQVPWIAFLHRAETDSTQRGVYPVYLFRADATGVYLTLAQGVTKAVQELGRPKAYEDMLIRARRVRDLLEREMPSFSFDTRVELRGSTALANDYEASVIAQRFYAADELPDDEELSADLSELIQAYTAGA